MQRSSRPRALYVAFALAIVAGAAVTLITVLRARPEREARGPVPDRSAAPDTSARPAPSAAPLAFNAIKRDRPATGTMDIRPFLQAGCTASVYGLDCTQSSALRAIGCARGLRVDDLLTGFSPRLAIAECAAPAEQGSGRHVRSGGCMLPSDIRYVAWTGKAFSLLDTAETLQKAFAPVDSPAEALALAVAISGDRALDELRLGPESRALVPEAETTHVTEDAEGWLVRLFGDPKPCGCSRHPLFARDWRVRRDGAVELARAQAISELNFERCAD